MRLHSDTVGLALVVGGMAFLFSGLIFLIPVRDRRYPPQESFEGSQKRIEQHLREMRKGEIDSSEEASPSDRFT